MKTKLFDFYPPTPDEYEKLWAEGLIVFDTNVLLDLYRLPTIARNELLDIFEKIKDRIWIPHQVGLEFQKRRISVISTERRAIQSALSETTSAVDAIKKKIAPLQLDKRDLQIDSDSLLSELESAHAGLVKAVNKAHESQLDVSTGDPIRDQLDKLFDSCLGDGPLDQSAYDLLVRNGEQRYGDKIPPGFQDADKDKNPNEATFVFNHIRYIRKFGDLVLWKQLIEHVRINGIKAVLLVTSDRKEDWWWIEQGKTQGPHPELRREIKRDGETELFWMYSSAQFLELSGKYLQAKVSPKSVLDMKDATESRGPLGQLQDSMLKTINFDIPFHDKHDGFLASSDSENHIIAWLSAKYQSPIIANHRGFPDFVVENGEQILGYEVKFLRKFDRMLFSPQVINSLLRGYMEVSEGRLSSFNLVIVIPREDFWEIVATDREIELQRRVRRLMQKYPADSIIVGTLHDEVFVELMVISKSDSEIPPERSNLFL